MCFVFQLRFALVLAVFYCVIQMIVLVGLIVQMAATNKLCDPTTFFFLFVAVTFVLAALLHPQEFWCLIHGFVYYLAIPTMYMLLMIYSMCNIHVVSWGTREVKQTPTEKQMEEQRKEMAELKRLEEEKKKKGDASAFLPSMLMPIRDPSKDEEGWSFGCGGCFKCTCCPHEVSHNEKVVELKLILSEMQRMQSNVTSEMLELRKAFDTMAHSQQQDKPQLPDNEAVSVVTQQEIRDDPSQAGEEAPLITTGVCYFLW